MGGALVAHGYCLDSPIGAPPAPQMLQVIFLCDQSGLFGPCNFGKWRCYGCGQGGCGVDMANTMVALGLHGFLGHVGYYQKFIRDFGLIVTLLMRLLQ